MQKQVSGRGNAKTYWYVTQALTNDTIIITRTSEGAKYINEIILPEAIKNLQEETNIIYDCEEIAFDIDDLIAKIKRDKLKTDSANKIITSCINPLKSDFKIETIDGEDFKNYPHKSEVFSNTIGKEEYERVFEGKWGNIEVEKD